MPLIGTAGHVDHGKSTLIQRITGRDPDRWEEEKRRGLTIDLGFAWTTLDSGVEVSFVDVPGHERFLKNMLAGIEAIEVALFVVAADEGWMPQSEEHLAVLDLLEVSQGVVALTKSDLVDADLLELAVAEVTERLAGTSLEDAPIVPVSAVTGQGVASLVEELAGRLPPPGDTGRPRLWVDRSFPVAGAGTVVTGSLLGSRMAEGDRVEIYPRGVEARVRSIQSHERTHHEVPPGRRVALNLAGVDHRSVARGDMIGRPGEWEPSDRFAVSLRPVRFVAEIDERGAYQIHIGSAAHRVDILGMSSGVAVLRSDGRIPMAAGDRFVLRDTGRRLVVAGGRILDPAPGRTRHALSAAAGIDPTGPVDEIADRLLSIRGQETLTRLTAHSAGGRPRQGVIVGGVAVDPGRFAQWARKAVALVEQAHRDRPLRTGLPIATLAERLGVDPSLAEAVVEESAELVRVGPDVARVGHQTALRPDQEAAWERAVDRMAQGLAVPLETELGLDPEVIALKLRSGDLVRIGPGLVYLPDQVEQIRSLIGGFDGEFTVADFRDAAGLSRKYAVPVLEWSDREGLTVRRGDTRSLR